MPLNYYNNAWLDAAAINNLGNTFANVSTGLAQLRNRQLALQQEYAMREAEMRQQQPVIDAHAMQLREAALLSAARGKEINTRIKMADALGDAYRHSLPPREGPFYGIPTLEDQARSDYANIAEAVGRASYRNPLQGQRTIERLQAMYKTPPSEDEGLARAILTDYHVAPNVNLAPGHVVMPNQPGAYNPQLPTRQTARTVGDQMKIDYYRGLAHAIEMGGAAAGDEYAKGMKQYSMDNGSGTNASLPQVNQKGWKLHVDKNGKQAYVSPDGSQYEEVQ